MCIEAFKGMNYSLESICFSFRVDGWFHRWYYFNENLMMSKEILIVFFRSHTQWQLIYSAPKFKIE